MKKIIFILFLIGNLTYGQEFPNIGFENTSCVNDCTDPNNGQMSCVNGWWEDIVQGVVPLKNINCDPNLVCSGNNSIYLVSTSGAPGSSIRTTNPFFGLNSTNGFTIDLTVNRSSNGASNGVVKVVGRHAGQFNWDVVGQAGPNSSDVCEDISIILDPSVVDYEELSFVACTATGTCHGGVGNYIVVDDIRVGKPIVEISDDCGLATISINSNLNIEEFFVEIIDSNGNDITDLFNQTGDPLTHEFENEGTYTFNVFIIHTVNGQSEFIIYELTHTIVFGPECCDDIDTNFTLDYYCHDGVYDVIATTLDQNQNQGWELWETSVEGSTNGNDIIALIDSQYSWQPPGLTTVTFTDLDPNKFYFIKHGIWEDHCDWRETRIALDRDCCIDDPVIIPYCEDPCALDSFPLKVKGKDGNIITILDGATFSWTNTTTGANSSNDIVIAAEFDHWFLTLTMPDGCIYNLEYKLICCEDDIQLEAYECPTSQDIAALEAQLQSRKSTLDKKTYDKYSNYLNAFKGGGSAEDCDPCESGLFIIRVVDGNGNLVTNFTSITWSDGLYTNQNIRWGEINTTYSVTVVVPASNGIDTCTYTDEIIYECKDDCTVTAPTNLQNNGATLSWDPVPGAVSYIISSPSQIKIKCCITGVSIAPQSTTNTFFTLSSNLQSRCFVWQVTAVCADGSLSPVSNQSCHLPSQINNDGGGVKDKVSIYPNPNQGKMTVKVELSDDSDIELNVYKFDGTLIKTIKNVKTENTILSLDLQLNLPSGLYFFNFKTNEGPITKRVIIE